MDTNKELIAEARTFIPKVDPEFDADFDFSGEIVIGLMAAFAETKIRAERERIVARLNRIMTAGEEPTTESWNQALATAIRIMEQPVDKAEKV